MFEHLAIATKDADSVTRDMDVSLKKIVKQVNVKLKRV